MEPYDPRRITTRKTRIRLHHARSWGRHVALLVELWFTFQNSAWRLVERFLKGEWDWHRKPSYCVVTKTIKPLFCVSKLFLVVAFSLLFQISSFQHFRFVSVFRFHLGCKKVKVRIIMTTVSLQSLSGLHNDIIADPSLSHQQIFIFNSNICNFHA